MASPKATRPNFIKGSTEFLVARRAGEYTPAQLADNPQLVRMFVESPAYEQFGKGRASNAQKFLSGIMEAGALVSWPSRTLKTEMGATAAKEAIVADPTRARIKSFHPTYMVD